MIDIKPITQEEGVLLRDFLAKFGRHRLNELLYVGKPLSLDRDEILKNDSESIARVASMHAGYDAAVDHLFSLAAVKRTTGQDSPHSDMMS